MSQTAMDGFVVPALIRMNYWRKNNYNMYLCGFVTLHYVVCFLIERCGLYTFLLLPLLCKIIFK